MVRQNSKSNLDPKGYFEVWKKLAFKNKRKEQRQKANQVYYSNLALKALNMWKKALVFNHKCQKANSRLDNVLQIQAFNHLKDLMYSDNHLNIQVNSESSIDMFSEDCTPNPLPLFTKKFFHAWLS